MVKKLQKNKAKKENINKGGKDYLLKIKLTAYFSTAYQKDNETVSLKG